MNDDQQEPDQKTRENFPITHCVSYSEDWAVCDDMGEPKGQCTHCGYKWYEHKMETLPEHEKDSAARIQEEKDEKGGTN